MPLSGEALPYVLGIWQAVFGETYSRRSGPTREGWNRRMKVSKLDFLQLLPAFLRLGRNFRTTGEVGPALRHAIEIKNKDFPWSVTIRGSSDGRLENIAAAEKPAKKSGNQSQTLRIRRQSLRVIPNPSARRMNGPVTPKAFSFAATGSSSFPTCPSTSRSAFSKPIRRGSTPLSAIHAPMRLASGAATYSLLPPRPKTSFSCGVTEEAFCLCLFKHPFKGDLRETTFRLGVSAADPSQCTPGNQTCFTSCDPKQHSCPRVVSTSVSGKMIAAHQLTRRVRPM